MNTPEATDDQLTTLFHESTATLEPDVTELVAGGVARGRTARRRRRAGAALGALAVVGVVGLAVGIGSAVGGSDSPEQGVVADQGSDKPSDKPRPSAPEGGPGVDADLTVPARDAPGLIASMLPPGELGPVLQENGFPLVDEPRHKIVHFLWNGTLTTFSIQPASGLGSCTEFATPPATCEVVDGLETLTYPPTELDQVTAQEISVWKHGYVIGVLSYNAPDGKDVAPVMDQPAISLEQLTEIARSDAWFS